MTALKILKAARALVRKGWIKGTMVNRNRYCEYGAIRKAAFGKSTKLGTNPEFESALKALSKTLPGNYRNNGGHLLGLASFNDSSTTTHADVIAHFDRAIDLLS